MSVHYISRWNRRERYLFFPCDDSSNTFLFCFGGSAEQETSLTEKQGAVSESELIIVCVEEGASSSDLYDFLGNLSVCDDIGKDNMDTNCFFHAFLERSKTDY